MNRHGGMYKPDCDTSEVIPAKPLDHDTIARQTEEFLARGGKVIQQPPSAPARCEKSRSNRPTSFDRKWAPGTPDHIRGRPQTLRYHAKRKARAS